jgi:ATP-binding cassette subfamily B protein
VSTATTTASVDATTATAAPPSRAHTVIQCLTAIARHHGLAVNPERLIHDFAPGDTEPSTPVALRIAREIGLKADARRLDWTALVGQSGVFPILARQHDGRAVIVLGVRDRETANARVAVLDPTAGGQAVALLDRLRFEQGWDGEVVLLKRRHALRDPGQPFGLRWFVPELLAQRSAFRDIAIAALALHVLALAAPIFFQLVIDKVLVHQSSATLWVLAAGVTIAIVFEVLFGFVRQTLTLAATNRIDMRLTRRAFAHLLALPIEYFETHTAGVVVRHMQQLERIRHFLTGRLFMTALDTTALVVFVPLLFLYSVPLAAVTLLFAAAMAVVVATLVPAFRRRLNALYTAEAERQGLLVETIHGMRTVKALALEPAQRRAWDQASAAAITMHWRVGRLSIAGTSVTGLLEKLLPITIIVLGAQAVFDRTLTVGALIAFQMIAQRVVSPLVQIVALINEYQETALSVRMLGDVMNRAPEGRPGGGGLRPAIAGEITFDGVTFRYPGAATPSLDGVGFRVRAGSVVGIVGRSGSGKTTLARLLQGLYRVEEGVVRFDGTDVREIDLAHLRRQVGVVLQDNFLFRGTVRDNIAITRPEATFDEIAAAAAAAGADEFIERLPQGFDTPLEENAANLSGGQKQRLAIARALLAQPRVLILDEAASALDPESEAIFMRNLARIAVGRTVVMISHRLSTLVDADAILVLQQGRLIDTGRHVELVARCAPYRQLWEQQRGSVQGG